MNSETKNTPNIIPAVPGMVFVESFTGKTLHLMTERNWNAFQSYPKTLCGNRLTGNGSSRVQQPSADHYKICAKCAASAASQGKDISSLPVNTPKPRAPKGLRTQTTPKVAEKIEVGIGDKVKLIRTGKIVTIRGTGFYRNEWKCETEDGTIKVYHRDFFAAIVEKFSPSVEGETVPAEEPAVEETPAPAQIGYKYDYSPAREKNERNYKGEPGVHEPCFICGKAVDTTKPHYMVHIVDGGGIAATEEEAKHFDPNGDMGSFPVGSECIRKQPGLKSRATLVNPLSPSPEGDDLAPVESQQPQPEPQETPAPKKRGIIIPDPNNAGLILSRKNRTMGFYTSLYKSDEAGIESDPELPYTTVCEQHGLLVCHSTRRLAMMSLSQPYEWCAYCQDLHYRGVDTFDQELGG